MNVRHLLTQTVTVTRVTMTGAVDGFGDPTEQTSTASYAGWLHQQQRSELTENENTQQERWALYLEPAAAGSVDGGDRVTVDGVAYELDGPPWPAFNPRTKVTEHVECTVRRAA